MGVGDNKSFKIYIRLPIKIEEELQIKNLHPDIQVVKIPRQKSRRWCFIIFQDKDTQDKVVKHLKGLRIDKKKIVVKPFKQRESRKTISQNKAAIETRLELLKKE